MVFKRAILIAILFVPSTLSPALAGGRTEIDPCILQCFWDPAQKEGAGMNSKDPLGCVINKIFGPAQIPNIPPPPPAPPPPPPRDVEEERL